jgi:hypothetical protein
LEPGYQPPVTFVVVQKGHHTRLFANNHNDRNSTDRSGNILPGKKPLNFLLPSSIITLRIFIKIQEDINKCPGRDFPEKCVLRIAEYFETCLIG